MTPGAIVGERFVIERPLGAGGMAEVFVATDRLRGGRVALKLFPSENAELRARFEREAETLAGLAHPGIVAYVAHGAPPEGPLYLAMELLEGEDLHTRIDRAPLSVEEALAAVGRVAEALSVAHARGIVHRDIKPANLFLVGGSVDAVKILDFGIVRIAAASTLTRAGFALGTPEYMAPEQARGDAILGPAVDVFALGCVLFECLAGRTPFAAAAPLAILSRILLEEAPRVRSLRPEVPREVDELIARLLTKEPSARPRDAAAALREIERAKIAARSATHELFHEETSRSLTVREQQLLCLLFVDHVARGEDRASPAAWNAASGVEWIAREHGARAERLIDGTLIIVVPGRGGGAEQAQRAVRTAFAIQAALPARDMVLVSGRAELSGAQPMGELIDRGAALLARARAATPSQATASAALGVPIDRVTAELVASAFQVVEQHGAFWVARQVDLRGSVRTVLGRHQPCVGRDDVFAAIARQVEGALRDRAPSALLVTGAPGIGKSRVRAEVARWLTARVPDAFMVFGRGDSARLGEPFGLLSSSLRAALGLREDMPIEQRRERVLRYVAAALGGPEPTMAPAQQAYVLRVAEFLGELARTPFPDDASPLLRAARAEGIRMGDQMWRAWLAFLDGVTQSRSLVFLLDDVDLADQPSLAYLDAALRNLEGRPIVALAFARPEVDARFPGLWAERRHARIELGPLDEEASLRLVRGALGQRATPELERDIAQRGGGNPLYLEEIVRAVASGAGPDALPPTVLAMVEARLEGLAPETRRVLRACSVLGRVAWRGAIATLCGAEAATLDAALAVLVREEILVDRGAVTFADDVDYAFRHAIVRDAAYAMLTADDRKLGHDLAGRWLAEKRPGEALAIAEHFDKAGEPRAAIAWYERSAELALEGNDFRSAIERCERAEACGAEGLALGKLKLLASECHRHLGSNVGMLERADEAREILVRRTTPWFRAVANVVLGAIRLGRKELVEECIAELGRELTAPSDAPFPAPAARIAHYLHFAGFHDFATRLLSAAWSDRDASSRDAGDEALAERAAWFHRASATRALLNGDLGSYLEHLERAVASFERAGDVREPASERVNVGFAQVELGMYEAALTTLTPALRDAEALGLLHTAGTAHDNLGAALSRLGRFDEASAHLGRAIATFSGQKNRRMEGNARIYLGELHLERGELDLAEKELRAAIELLAQVKPLRQSAEAALAEVLLRAGRLDEAAALSSAASEALAVVGHLDEGESLVRLVEVEVFRAQGRPDDAARAAIAARDRVLERAARIREPAWRASFLAVRENAKLLELAGARDP